MCHYKWPIFNFTVSLSLSMRAHSRLLSKSDLRVVVLAAGDHHPALPGKVEPG
jgi:hypothetical protein